MQGQYDSSFEAFSLAQSRHLRDQLLALPWQPQQQAHYEALASASLAQQQAIEAADTEDFETWRQQYMNPQQLG